MNTNFTAIFKPNTIKKPHILVVFGVVLFFILVAKVNAVTCAINATAGMYSSAIDVSQGTQRYFRYKIPNNYNPKAQNGYPIIFAFHGGFQSALGFSKKEGQVRMRELANQREFILVYPQGNSLPNPVAPTCPPSKDYFLPAVWEGITTQINSPDIQFVEELFALIDTALNIDNNKVYAVGFSNGGTIAHRLGGERSERFTAIAAVAAAMGARYHVTANAPAGAIDYWTVPLVPPKPTKVPVPVMMIHSESDPIVPFNGGPAILLSNYDLLSNGDNWAHWYEANDCDVIQTGVEFPNIALTGGGMGYRLFNLCKDHYFTAPLVNIVFDNLIDNDHRWPHLSKDGYDTSEVIVDFLLQFSR